MAASKKTPPVPLSSPVPDSREGGIRISITNQHGQRYRYRAQAVSLSMRNGTLQVVENDARCFLWFDRCDLEVRDARRTLRFHLQTGSASKLADAELVILAQMAPSAMNAKTPRLTPAPSRSAKPIKPAAQ